VLSAKTETTELFVAESHPQMHFRRGHPATKLSGTFGYGVSRTTGHDHLAIWTSW
jgi:hypothetical protein